MHGTHVSADLTLICLQNYLQHCHDQSRPPGHPGAPSAPSQPQQHTSCPPATERRPLKRPAPDTDTEAEPRHVEAVEAAASTTNHAAVPDVTAPVPPTLLDGEGAGAGAGAGLGAGTQAGASAALSDDAAVDAAAAASQACASVRGVIIALCCHQRCDWSKYCNQVIQ